VDKGGSAAVVAKGAKGYGFPASRVPADNAIRVCAESKIHQIVQIQPQDLRAFPDATELLFGGTLSTQEVQGFAV